MGSEAERDGHTAMDAGSVLCEVTVRAAWRRLISDLLPAAAPRLGCPSLTPLEMEHALLDRISDTPRASGRDACAIDLVLAIELAERALDGEVCLGKLASHSRALREGGRPLPRDRRGRRGG